MEHFAGVHRRTIYITGLVCFIQRIITAQQDLLTLVNTLQFTQKQVLLVTACGLRTSESIAMSASVNVRTYIRHWDIVRDYPLTLYCALCNSPSSPSCLMIAYESYVFAILLFSLC